MNNIVIYCIVIETFNWISLHLSPTTIMYICIAYCVCFLLCMCNCVYAVNDNDAFDDEISAPCPKNSFITHISGPGYSVIRSTFNMHGIWCIKTLLTEEGRNRGHTNRRGIARLAAVFFSQRGYLFHRPIQDWHLVTTTHCVFWVNFLYFLIRSNQPSENCKNVWDLP